MFFDISKMKDQPQPKLIQSLPYRPEPDKIDLQDRNLRFKQSNDLYENEINCMHHAHLCRVFLSNALYG